MPLINGSSSNPLLVAEAPCTICWNCGRNVTAPNIASPVRKVSTMAAVKLRLVNSRSGRIGSATRRSTATNAPNASTLSAPRPKIGADVHSYSVPPRWPAG